MTVELPLRKLSAYLPGVSLRRAADADASALPARRQLWGSCLWVDVTGFTRLAQELTSRGPVGIEGLSQKLNRLYGRISASVEANGGDVLFFAGDGALCLWEVPAEQDMRFSACAAVEAALRVRAELEQLTAARDRLSLRQVLITGEMTLDTVGGEAGHWIDIVTGPPFEELPRLTSLGAAEQIVLSRGSVEALGSRVMATPVAENAFLLRHAEETPTSGYFANGLDLQDVNLENVRARVPEFLVQQLSASGLASAELRRVSVVFVQWKQAEALPLETVQHLTLATQQTAREHAGWLCQFVHDDKGLVGVVGFGLPGARQDEHAARAVRFARQLAERLAVQGPQPRIGVASGSVFCGSCGSDRRRQYCVLGSTVIRAARLSERASQQPLVDDETFNRASRNLSFAPQGLVHLKGIEQPLPAYRAAPARRELEDPSELIGRVEELDALSSALAAFNAGEAIRVLVVCGELGVGKSCFLSHVLPLSTGAKLTVCRSLADAVERHTGYFALRSVMHTWFGRPQSAAERQHFLSAIEAAGQSAELAPLLNPLLLSEFEPTALVRGMSPETRTENRKQLVTELIRCKLSDRKWVVVIDDAHWLDASSFELIDHLRRNLANLLWIFGERIPRDGDSALATELGGARRIRLQPLQPESVGRLIAHITGAREASAELSVATDRAGRGNPLHCIEYVRALSACGRLRLHDGLLALDDQARGLFELPATLEELIQSRFDRLSPSTRQVLHAASVLGNRFEEPVLGELLNMRSMRQHLEQALAEAQQAGVVRPLTEAHEFEHDSVRSVIQGLILPSEQRLLHELAARALESVHAGTPAAVIARLAFHWAHADNAKKAAEASALAAQQALNGYANSDAAHLFTQALDQDHRWRGALKLDLKRAQWSLWLAQALYSQSRHREARDAYVNAIQWTGFSPPGGALDLPLTIVQALLANVGAALRPARAAEVGEDTREQYLCVMRVIHAWGTLDLWEGRLLEAVNKSFLGYRLAQMVGTTAEAAETISGFGYMLAATPARSYSERELLRGVKIADAADELQARTSARVLLGMYYTMVGRTGEALSPLRVSGKLADRLGSGLWRHRACFGLGEALLFAGDLVGAQQAFAKAARIASDAEPPVEGFANCMAALAAARQGRLERACEIIDGERGVRLVEGNCLLLQRFVSLGIHSELLFHSGREAIALAVAERALGLSESSPAANVFFAALQGHAGVAAVFLYCLERQHELASKLGAHWNRRRLLKKAEASVRQLRAFAKMYPGARAQALISVGRCRRLQGNARAANACWERALTLARTAQQPYELAQALDLLSVHGGNARCEARRREVVELGQRYGVVPEYTK